MKRIALLALVGIFCQCAFSQNLADRLCYQTEVAVGFPLLESHGTPMRLCQKVMYGLNPRLTCGFGAGFSRYDKTLVPLFADLQWSVARPRQFTPFVEVRAGYSFAPSPLATGGSNLGLGFGTFRYAAHLRFRRLRISAFQPVKNVRVGCRTVSVCREDRAQCTFGNRRLSVLMKQKIHLTKLMCKMDFSLFLTCNNVARITAFYNLLSTVYGLFQSVSHFEGIQAVLAIFAGLANVELASAV